MSSLEWALVAFTFGWFALLGGCFGSLLNVFLYRLPLGLSMIRPPSSCPACSREIAWYDNVPVFGWLMLRGRCRWCQAAISPRYPLIEALVAVEWVLVLSLWIVWEHTRNRQDWFYTFRILWEVDALRSLHFICGLALLLYWLTGTTLFLWDQRSIPRRWWTIGISTEIIWAALWGILRSI